MLSPKFRFLATVVALSLSLALHAARSGAQSSLANKEILIVRHGERPAAEDALTDRGKARAQAYVGYFEHLSIDGRPIHLTHLFAEKSRRTRETLEPLSKATGMELDTRFATKDDVALAADLQSHSYGNEVLICWHHHAISKLIKDLGGDPDAVIPGGKWPGSTYDWVIDLRFDGAGHLEKSGEKLIREHLMPGDPAGN
jgi:phosphohistidine phosphatase SixA